MFEIQKSNFDTYYVHKKTKTHTGVRWIWIKNVVDEFKTLEEAKQKYPKAKILDLGEEWFDRLAQSQNQPSNIEEAQ